MSMRVTKNMNSTSLLEKLLGTTPVEWRQLGNFVNVKRGKRLVKNQLELGN